MIYIIVYRNMNTSDNYDPDTESAPEPVFFSQLNDETSKTTTACKNSTESIDKMTLELFMNKKHYNKMLSKADPRKYADRQEHLENIKKYKWDIQRVINDLFENPDKQIGSDVDESFETFLKSTIRYLQYSDLNAPLRNYGADKDDDTMFDFDNYASLERPKLRRHVHGGEIEQPASLEKSLWGQARVVKKTTADFPMGSPFPRSRR